MKKKKVLRLTALATMMAMLTVGVAGCGSSGSGDEGNGGESGGDSGGQTITVAASTSWVKDVDKELAQKFEEETGNKIEWQLSPDDQYENVLNSKLAVGEAADIFYVRSGITLTRYQPDKYMMDLSDQEWVSRYNDWAKEGTTYNGKTVQFQTWSVDGWGLLYNKAMFEEAGITEVPTDYASFKDACDKILAIGKTPIYQPGAAQWHWSTWLGEMTTKVETDTGNYYDGLNDNSQTFAGQEDLKTALDQLVEMNEAGYFGDDVMSNTWEDMVSKMASGDYAMGLVYTTFPAEVEAANPEMTADSWGMFPIPLADNTTFGVSAGGMGRCVNKDTKVEDAVKEYLDFLSQPENLQTYYDARLDLGPCSFTDIPGNVPAVYEEVMNNASASGLTAEDGISYWDATQVGNLIQAMFVGGTSADDVLSGIDDIRQPNF